MRILVLYYILIGFLLSFSYVMTCWEKRRPCYLSIAFQMQFLWLPYFLLPARWLVTIRRQLRKVCYSNRQS